MKAIFAEKISESKTAAANWTFVLNLGEIEERRLGIRVLKLGFKKKKKIESKLGSERTRALVGERGFRAFVEKKLQNQR